MVSTDRMFFLVLRLASLAFGALLVPDSARAQCNPPPSTYCTPKTTSNGCVPQIGFTGSNRIGAADFVILANQVEGDEQYVFIYGVNGPTAQPFQHGFLCVAPPVERLPPGPPWPFTGGTAEACDGVMSQAAASVLMNVGAGNTVWFQGWFRDNNAASGTGLTDGLEVFVCP